MAFFSRGKVYTKMADHGLDDPGIVESLFLLGYIGLKDLCLGMRVTREAKPICFGLFSPYEPCPYTRGGQHHVACELCARIWKLKNLYMEVKND